MLKLQYVLRLRWLLVVLLLPASWASSQTDVLITKRQSGIIYSDVAITAENTPKLEIALIGGGAVEIMWFYGVPQSDYVHGSGTPAENTLLKTDSRAEPDFWEDTQAYYTTDLVGTTLQGSHTIWASVQLPEQQEIAIFDVQVDGGAFVTKRQSGTIYADIAITTFNTPKVEIILIGGGAVEVIWFYGEPQSGYVHGSGTPADNTLLKTDSRAEPDFWEELQAYYTSDLVGTTLQGDHRIWASVQLPGLHEIVIFNTQVEQGDPPPPPVDNGWAEGWPVQQPDDSIPSLPEHYLLWNKVFSGYIRGTDFSEGFIAPYLDVNFPGPWTIAFYHGEVGDTSQLIYAGAQGEVSSIGSSVLFDNYIVSETTRVWARIENGESQLDSNPILINAIDPESVELVEWPDTIKDADVGSQVTLKPEFNIHISGAMTVWIYQGESGDTSTLVSEITPNDIPIISLTVPESPTYFWVRIQYGDFIIDTPSTLVSPLPVEAPVILDQPDDVYLGDFRSWAIMRGLRIGATGGNLNFQWYEGLPGDRTTLLGHSFEPLSEGNLRSMSVDLPASSDYVYARIWNSEGEVESRPVKVGTSSIEDTYLLNYPLRVRLRQRDLLQAETVGGYFDIFWCDHLGAYWDVTLMKEEGGSFVDVYTKFFAGGFPFYFYFSESNKRVIAASLPSGTYKYRVFSGAQFYESEPFEFFNECLDTNPLYVMPAAYPMAPAGVYSNGGIFTAKVYLTTFIDRESMQVYAGPVGDRSHPVSFDTDHSPLFSQLYKGMDFGQYVVTVNWPSTGQDMYWFEALTHNGGIVRCVLRYPLGSASSSENGHVTTVLLPPGSDVIPIPNLDTLPDVETWRFGEADGEGSRVTLPLELPDLNQAHPNVTLWDDQDLPVEQLDLQIDPDAPPQFLELQEKAAVLPSGRVLWTSRVNGDVNRTIATSMDNSGVWEPVMDSFWKVTQGFVVPEGSNYLKTTYMMDDKSSERIFTLNWIQTAFLEAAEVSRTEQNTLVTERMGTFLEAQEFPYLRHAELGWMYTYAVGEVVLFYGETIPGRTDWHWMHPAYYPFFYNFGTESWVYYWVNSYGWFYDFGESQWYLVGVP